MINSDELNSYLFFGYVPDHEKAHAFISWLDSVLEPGQVEADNHDALVDLGIAALRESYSDIPSGDHIVPLSGGLDSRCVLGNLLEHFDASQIHTVTFGTPGALDFEIGKTIAKKVGTKHTAIDLLQLPLSLEKLVSYAAKFEKPIPLYEGFYNYQIPELFGNTACYWIGFMPMSGAHFKHGIQQTWHSALFDSLKYNQYGGSVSIFETLDFINSFPQKAMLPREKLNYYEQMDFAYRQQCYVRPHIIYDWLGFRYVTPFLHPAWINFILRVPIDFRLGKTLYRRVLERAFPYLFSLPRKENQGWRKNETWLNKKIVGTARRIKNRIRPASERRLSGGNYLRFAAAFRDRDDFKAIGASQLNDLKSRGILPYVDSDRIWHEHQRGIGDHATLIQVLSSLEIWYKAHEHQAM